MLEVFTFIVAIVLVLLPLSDWTASYILHKASKRAHELNKDNIALKERATIAIILAFIGTANGVLGLFRLLNISLDPVIATLVLSFALISIGIPNLYWLWLYYRNKMHK